MRSRARASFETERAAPTLAELQRWLRWVIVEPRGSEAALAGSGSLAEPKPRCLELIAHAPPIPVARRLEIYAEAYFERLAEALAQDFGALRRALGEGGFRRLALEYLEAHPSRSPVIGDLGRSLPAFLRTHGLLKLRPFLAALAELEWALLESFHSESSPCLNPGLLASVAPERWPKARFLLNPSLRFVQTRWAVDELRQDLLQRAPAKEALPGDPRELLPEEGGLLVWRKGFDVRIERLEPEAFQALQSMRQGLSLEEICETASAQDRVLEPRTMTQWFSRWVRDGWIREIIFPPRTRAS